MALIQYVNFHQEDRQRKWWPHEDNLQEVRGSPVTNPKNVCRQMFMEIKKKKTEWSALVGEMFKVFMKEVTLVMKVWRPQLV